MTYDPFGNDYMKQFVKDTSEVFIKKDKEKKYMEDEDKKIAFMKAWRANYDIQIQQPINERIPFTDEYGYNICSIKTHEKERISKETGKAWNIPKPVEYPHDDYPNEYELTCEFPLMKEVGKYPTDINIKAPKGYFFYGEGDKIPEGNKIGDLKPIRNVNILVRGELYVRYTILGQKGSDWKNDFLKKKGKFDGKSYRNIKEVDINEYRVWYTFRIFQTLHAKKVAN